MGQVLQHVHYFVTHSMIAGEVSLIFLHSDIHHVNHQGPVTVILRIDGSEFHIINNEQHHGKGDGKSRTGDVDGREQFVLSHHVPCLFEMLCYHKVENECIFLIYVFFFTTE
jgi:hypothetical protein